MTMMKEGYTQPLPTAKSVRPDEWRGLTSVKAGVITPIAYIPLLREDRVRANVTVQVTSEETLHTIVNPVRVRAEAFLVPKTVLERFQGSLEMLNRAYEGKAAPPGMGTTPKWFVHHPTLSDSDAGHELFDKLGIHYNASMKFNTDLVESYNQLVNWMRMNVSPGLPLADLANTTCLPAFWESWRFADIKPSFDAAQMEGVVPVGIDGTAPVKGIASFGASPVNAGGASIVRSGNNTNISLTADGAKGLSFEVGAPGVSTIRADLSGAGASISLANIEAAKKTQAFAMMRDRYRSVPDEYLIDLLMAGINIPDADLRQPIRIAMAEAVLGQTERYATDGASLDTSVSNGVATLNFSLNTPPVNTGGLVLVCLSIVPEQLYERVRDVALRYERGDIYDTKTPKYVEDYLDPQKVEVVPNEFADVFHSTPTGVFGYAPLNFEWRRSRSAVGGKFKRPTSNAFVEERQRIWSVDKDDPALSADFYLCPVPFPHDVFAIKTEDPYEVITVVQGSVVGSTVFGPSFEEDLGSYDAIISQVDMERIEQPGIFGFAADAPVQPVTTAAVTASEEGNL